MKLYHIPRYVALMLAAITTVSCADLLNLEPQQNISEELALNSDANVKTVLIGAYDALSNGDLYGGNIQIFSELLGGDGEVRWVGTFDAPRQIFNKQISVTNGDVQDTWIQAYDAINICNNVLASLEVVNAEDQDQVKGEALFIRSAIYFELVRLYAPQYESSTVSSPGVPLVLTPTRSIDESSKLARNTVGEVYTQVITDLELAASILPESNGVFAAIGAAEALLARVYLQKGDYAAAALAATLAINAGGTLNPDYGDAFNNSSYSSEDIFAITVTTQDGVNWMNLFFSIPIYGGRDGDIEIQEDHLALYDSLDSRLALFFVGAGATRTGKWNNQFGNVNIIRLAEMYLIRAESNQRLSSTVGASPLEDYNKVHTRAGLAAATEVTLEDILLERRLELAHEGAKIHDNRRLGLAVGGRPYNDPRLVFPIPQREIDVNSNLVQNTGY